MNEDLFKKLPPEILSEIFSYELLVPYRKILPGQTQVTYSQGITIIDGKAEYPFPTALFKVDRNTSHIAQRCTYSINRFILGGKPDVSLAWLSARPLGLLKLIRRLDLMILPYQFDNNEALKGFDKLLAAVSQSFELGTLSLSLDGSRMAAELDEEINSHEWLKDTYQKLLQMFMANHDISMVKDFFVYYPQWRSEEFKLERAVKGEHYDSVARGKKPFPTRDQRLIHGWEYGGFKGDGSWDISSDLEEYGSHEGIVGDSFVDTIDALREDFALRARDNVQPVE